jgi:hypothetical protein
MYIQIVSLVAQAIKALFERSGERTIIAHYAGFRNPSEYRVLCWRVSPAATQPVSTSLSDHRLYLRRRSRASMRRIRLRPQGGLVASFG